MQIYEINYLILQSKNANLEKIRGSVKELLEKSGAQITEEKEYLKRKLAYEIKHESYGFYTVLRFKIEEKDNLNSIKKELNLNHDIIRHIIIGADNLPSLKESEEIAKQQKEPAKKEAKHETIKAEDVEKMISESPVEKKEEAIAKQPQTEKTDKKESRPEEKAKEKEEKKKEEEIEKKDDKNSLDELDKKLDEILNI